MTNHDIKEDRIIIKPIQVMTTRYGIIRNGICIATSERKDIAEGLAMFLEGETDVPHRPTIRANPALELPK